MLDAYANCTFEKGDRVFGDELFEGDEEAGLEGYETLDGCGTVPTSACFAEEQDEVTYCSGVEAIACHSP